MLRARALKQQRSKDRLRAGSGAHFYTLLFRGVVESSFQRTSSLPNKRNMTLAFPRLSRASRRVQLLNALAALLHGVRSPARSAVRLHAVQGVYRLVAGCK